MQLIAPLLRRMGHVPRAELDKAYDDNTWHNASVYERAVQEAKEKMKQGLESNSNLAKSIRIARSATSGHKASKNSVRRSVNEALDAMDRKDPNTK